MAGVQGGLKRFKQRRIVKCGEQLVSYQKEVKLKSSGQKTDQDAAVTQYLHASATDCFPQRALKQSGQEFKGLVYPNHTKTHSLTNHLVQSSAITFNHEPLYFSALFNVGQTVLQALSIKLPIMQLNRLIVLPIKCQKIVKNAKKRHQNVSKTQISKAVCQEYNDHLICRFIFFRSSNRFID